MKDEAIISLYLARDESAVEKTAEAYGRYLEAVAYNVLGNRESSRECVNSAYYKLWGSIPPHEPKSLLTYACKIVRRLAIDAYRKERRKKRGGTEYELSLEELAECVPGSDGPEGELEAKRLSEAINAYVASLTEEAQTVFAQRYYFSDPIKDIAACHGMSVPKVKSMLHRIRRGLKEHLIKEGFEL